MSERSGSFLRRCAAAVAVLAVAGSLAGCDRTPGLPFGSRAGGASAPISAPALRFVDAINHFRGAHGLPPLTVYDNLDDKAVLWSAYMAGGNCGRDASGAPALCHSDLTAGIEMQWAALAENVGSGSPGSDLGALERRFEASPTHAANMLNPSASGVGVGVAYWGGTIYVAEEFLAR